MIFEIEAFGMGGNKDSLQARISAIQTWYGFDPEFDTLVVHKEFERWPMESPWVDPSELEGLIGTVSLEFVSNVVPWATAKVKLPAHEAPAWAEEFQRGHQWELLTVKQLPS